MITTEFKKAIDQAENIVIFTHVGPDGDALGSMTAMGQLLTARGKQITMVVDSPIPPRFSYLPFIDKVQAKLDAASVFDLIITLDCGDEERPGKPLKQLKQKPTLINIDHHVTNTYFGDINWVDPKATSTAEMLYQLFVALDVAFTPDMATSLLTGLVTDTLGFRTPNVSANTLKIGGALMDTGADLTIITAQTLNLQPMSTLRLWQTGLNHMKLEDGLMWTTISREERARAGHRGDSSSGLVNFLADVDRAAIGVVLMEMDDGEIRVGFRCQPPYDVSGLATELGGGGHPQAAGCTLEGPLAKAEVMLVDKCKELISQQTPACDNGRFE
ncbi:MAG: bifunctional oligoribonuclease/PAP phosphatase NrnA [Anaerolineae bacterium]|nr:bifunctional oligoribonuclease/PAP phosphatase NrnA [Anaerolineae bacterium]